ncbi:MAG: hypothetical protein GY822_27765 [Deltaproteobacteria bacterium]|nr:hypothetical protein [Deltaproteobacteria bacterium]
MLQLVDRVGVLTVGTFADQGVLPPTDEEFEFIVQGASLVSVVTGRIDAEKKTSRPRIEVTFSAAYGIFG